MFAHVNLKSIARLADDLAAKYRRSILRIAEARAELTTLTALARQLDPQFDLTAMIQDFEPSLRGVIDINDSLSIGGQYAQAHLTVTAKKYKLDAATQEANAGDVGGSTSVADLERDWTKAAVHLRRLSAANYDPPRDTAPTAAELSECSTLALRRVNRVIRDVLVSDHPLARFRHVRYFLKSLRLT